jgi:hypothetical protein
VGGPSVNELRQFQIGTNPFFSRIPKRLAWALLALGVLLLFFVLPHDIEGDGRLRFEALQSLLGGGGIPDTKYPLIGSIPSLPLFLLGHLVGSPEWWVSRYNVIVYAASLVLIYRLLRESLDHDVLFAFLLLLGTTAMIPASLTGFGAETFTVMATGVGFAAWSAGRWKTAMVLLALGIANVPATIVGVAFALGWWAWRYKRVRALAPLVLGAGLWLLENLLRHKSALTTGYENDRGFRTLLPYSGLIGFSYPVVFGVLSLLLSFGKGLLFFASGLVLAFGRGLEALRSVNEMLVLWVLYLAGLVVVYGSWWAWYGGFTWGPRFLVFASLPASLLLAAQLRRPPRRLIGLTIVVAALVLSVWVGIDGQVFGRFAQDPCSANHYSFESLCWYVPEFSALWTPVVFGAQVPWWGFVLIAYAVGVSIYIALPLITDWASALYRGGTLAWSAYRGRPGWRL